mgnify:CR=1 FL=1
MAKKGHTAEQIISKLREVEVLQGQGESLSSAVRSIGVTAHTYYRWRKQYGGMGVDQAKKLKQLEAENSRLKRAVADLTLDNQVLKEISKGKF